MEIKNLNIGQIKAAINQGDFTCVEVANYFLARARASQNNEFITIDEEHTLKYAKISDVHYRAGTARIIEGIPVAIKDLFCTRGIKTTAGSHMLENFVPPYESTVTTNLYNHGGVPLGKTNMDEFAMGSANTNSYFGAVISPWKDGDRKLVPGGSSGGSAAAVAGGLAVGALGSDTGGSIRQPASFTNTVGVKPTYGRCSRFGMVSFASSLDQAGVFASNNYDSALLLSSIAGYDPNDSTSVNRTDTNFTTEIGQGIKGVKIGVPKEYLSDDLDADIVRLHAQGLEILREAGAEIVPLSLPLTKYALPVYYILAPAEASSNLARYDGVRFGHRTTQKVTSLDEMYELTRAEGFGAEVKKRIMIGTYVLSHGYYDAYYKKAQRVRRLIADNFTTAFQKVDAIFVPSAPSTAFAIGEKMDNPTQMYFNDVFTVPASLAGLPCMNLPAGFSHNRLPIGMQLICDKFQENKMFRVADILEKGYKTNIVQG